MSQNQQEDLGKAQKSGAHPRGFASIGPGWGLRIGICHNSQATLRLMLPVLCSTDSSLIKKDLESSFSNTNVNKNHLGNLVIQILIQNIRDGA